MELEALRCMFLAMEKRVVDQYHHDALSYANLGNAENWPWCMVTQLGQYCNAGSSTFESAAGFLTLYVNNEGRATMSNESHVHTH